jgi:hypothetical protein
MFSQVVFYMDSIIIKNIVQEPSTTIMTYSYEGPVILVKCIILNNTKDTIILNNGELSLVFRYRGKNYINTIVGLDNPLNVRDTTDLLTILPNEKIDFKFSSSYLLGTDFFWMKYKQKKLSDKMNYTTEIIETIPTLKVRCFRPPLDITTAEIMNVTIKK